MYKHILYIVIAFLTFQVSAQWSPTTGPGGGTINCIFERDGIYYTGADAVYTSTDGGSNWLINNKGMPLTTKVNTINADNDYMYAGLSNHGVFRSNDMGESWTEANNGISEFGRWIQDIYETNGMVYAAAQHEGIYVSNNQGEDWVQKSNGLEGAALRVASIMEYNDTLFLATPLGVYRSENGGDLWVKSSSGIPENKEYSFDIVKNDKHLFVAVLDGIFRSSDAGLNWERVGEGIFSTGVYSITVFENNLYTGTNGRIFYSSDEGDNWTEIGSGVTQYSYIYTIGVNENSLICGVNQRGIFKFNTENSIWYQSNAGLINENVADMMVDGNEMIAATVRNDFGQIFKTASNGLEYEMWNNGGWDGGYNALINTGSHYLAGTDGGFLYRSADKGANWELIQYPEFPTSYVSSFCLKDGVVFAGSFGNTIDAYRSIDNGAIWENCNLPGEGNVMALIATTDYVFAGRSDGVFRSDDLGLNWIHTSDGMSDLPFIFDFTANDEYLFAAANDGLYRSADHGEQWEKVYFPPFSEQILSITAHGEFLYAGAEQLGLMISQDNGETWETSNPDFFQDPSGFYPVVNTVEIKGDSLYAAYKDYSIWVRPLPNITAVDDKVFNDEDDQNTLKVFPNPVKGTSTISYTMLSENSVYLKVYDILGKERLNLSFEDQKQGKQQIQLNVKGLEYGVYFLVLKAGNNISQQRIIVAE